MRFTQNKGKRLSDESIVHPLEKRIDYQFKNSLLLTEALTHPSVAHERKKKTFDNQRLEFLGDAVLQLVISEHLFARYADVGEGRLTTRRSRLVSRESLKRRAAALDLGDHLLMGRGEEVSGGRQRDSTLGDAFEALLGALYLDSDLETVRHFILEEMRDDLARLEEEPLEVNPKGQLQELLQAISSRSPSYEVLSQQGREHERVFNVRVVWEDQVLGEGSGRSKKQAESAAALAALVAQVWL